MRKSRILLVEDETDIRQLMLMHLGREGYETVVAEDGEKGSKLLSEEEFDLAVLDWMLPGISGLELAKAIRAKTGSLPILMVTARADAADIVLGLEMGADDYITKPFEIPVFLARVRALLRRASSVAGKESRVIRIEALTMDLDSHSVACDREELKLTPSEFKLLAALLENRGKVLSRERLIGLIQGEGVAVVERTVDIHVFGLRKKLGPCADIVETIRGVGYRVKS